MAQAQRTTSRRALVLTYDQGSLLQGPSHVQAAPKSFDEPDWQSPIDLAKTLASIPEARTISGMFLEPCVREARRFGKQLPSARERYVAFRFYPVREHVQLLVEACAMFYPSMPTRAALRKLGRAAPAALLTSTLGRATVGVAQGTLSIMDAMAKSYSVNLPGAEVTIMDAAANHCVVRMRSVPYFVDSHHVGAFEGVLRYAGVEGEVRLRLISSGDADLFCSWRSDQVRRER